MYFWNTDDFSRETYFAWNTKYYTFWIMGMIVHGLVFAPEFLLAIFAVLLNVPIVNTIYLYTCEHSMAGPFGVYWILFAFLVWTYRDPATDDAAAIPDDEIWWSVAVRNTLMSYIFVEAGMAFLQIWTMPAIREWIDDRNNELEEIGGIYGDVLRNDEEDYDSGDYIM